MVKKIILVFKTHFDIGFTDLSSKVIEKYATSMLQEAIVTCKATEHMGNQKYVWTMPAWPLKIVIERCDAQLRKELDTLIQKGQIVWHALPFTSHTDFCSVEEYVEGLRFSEELSKQYHKPNAITGKMTDVPGHSIMLPAILSGAGVKFLHLGCNEFASPPKLPFLFYWQAKSGEKVLTMYSKGGYGTSLLPPNDWEYPVWMALMHTQDNCGPQSAQMIEQMVHTIKRKYPEVEVVCGTMDEFYQDLSQCDLSNIPVIEKDLADTWIHGVGSYPKEISLMRELREKSRRLQALMAKQLLEGMTISDIKAMELLNQYYEQVSLFEEHTWGADIKTWLGPDRVYHKRDFMGARKSERYQIVEKSWNEQRDRVLEAKAILSEFNLLLEKNSNEEIALFNPGDSEYTGWVMLKEQKINLDNQSIEMKGKDLPITKIDGEWACFVRELPPFETVTLYLKDSKGQTPSVSISKEEDLVTVENHRYSLSFSELNGNIQEIFDKKIKRELLKQNEGNSVFSYQYDRYGIDDITVYLKEYAYRYSTWGIQDYGREAYPDCEHRTYIPKYKEYYIEGDTLNLCYEGQESVQIYGDAEQVRIAITLPPIGEELFVSVHLTNKKETPYVESGSFLMPFASEVKEYKINKTNTCLDVATDIQEGANHVFYCLENFMTASNGRSGVCILTKDSPLVSLGDTGVYRYRSNYVAPQKPIAYFNLFNNMWGTNFPQWIGGDLSYRFILFGYDDVEQSSIMERAAALQTGIELTKCKLEQNFGSFPERMQLINVRTEGKKLILRFRDLSGEQSKRRLHVKRYIITPINLRNQEIGDSKVNSYEFLVNPYGIYSFKFEKMDESNGECVE